MEQLTALGELPVVTGPPWPGVQYYCTTRLGGVSQGPWASLNLGRHTGDDPDHVTENWRRLESVTGPMAEVRQVHGTDVCDVDAIANGQTTAHIHADALISARRGQILAITTADCLPVVIGSTDGLVVGVAHAGWRGLAAGVLENTLMALQKKYPGPGMPAWRAWIGPGISRRHFEVGQDVHDAFSDIDRDEAVYFIPAGQDGKWWADLPAIARHRLEKKGVSHIDDSNLCTCERTDLFYSYRRDGVTGRIVTFVWHTG